MYQQLELGKHTNKDKWGDLDNDPQRFHLL